MRHPHGLRAAAGGDVGIPIGDAYEGGFFAGYISHTADGVATHGLIVAPAASGYNGGVMLQFKTFNTSTSTPSLFDGATNSLDLNFATTPAGQYCNGLTIGGYSDWYLPARDELDIAYENLKPSATGNNTGFGVNSYSVPTRTVNRTSGEPAQTSVAAFQSGGAEAFIADLHWSSTEFSESNAWNMSFANGNYGGNLKTSLVLVRAFRKFAL